MYLVKTPFWLRWIYSSLTWHKDRLEKTIYLTFDDGPIPVVTPYVINTLKKFNAKATFFCIGENVTKFPEIFDELLVNGHAVGNHTYNHLKGWNHGTKDYTENYKKCAQIIDSNLFRPPYGRITFSQITSLRKHTPAIEIVMWDVLSGDFDNSISADQCIENVISATRNGSIIVFHDSEKAFPRLETSLPIILEKLTAKGYSFKTLQEA